VAISAGKSAAKELLYRGDYRAVLDLYEARGRSALPRDLAVASVGALSFLGRTDEAAILFESQIGRLGLAERTEGLFYLSVNFARVQEWVRARAYLSRLRAERKAEPMAFPHFYYFQAAAFMRQGRSRFASARVFAEQAFAWSVREGFAYGKVLSSDLLGYALINSDRIRQGIKSLKQAQIIAREMGAEGLARAIEVSIRIHESQYGLVPLVTSVARLRRLMRRFRHWDSYSLINLHLELVRALTLAGRFRDSETELRAVLESIYLFNNPRQECTFKLRQAELSYRRGRYHDALEKILDGKRWAGLADNPLLRSQVLSLEHKIVRALGYAEKADALSSELWSLLEAFPSSLNRRMTGRALGRAETAPTDDPLGALIDRLSREGSEGTRVRRTLATQGYWGLLPAALGLKPGAKALIWELEEGSFTVVSQEGVVHQSQLRSKITRRILELLRRGPLEKRELVRAVWGYEYHPLKHDAVLYAAIAQCRKLLGDAASWLENHENSYGLSRSIVFVDLASMDENVPGPRVSTPLAPQDLNFRQVACIKTLKGGQFLSIPGYCREHRISRNTATRDLRALEERGFLEARGKGPSRRYARPEQNVIEGA
jgi:hypothetical protein